MVFNSVMSIKPETTLYNPVEVSGGIRQIKEIEMECGLSTWSECDYEEEQLRKDSIFLAVRVGENIVGFLVTRFFGAEADLLNFGVLESYRRQGIGKILFSRLVLEAAKREVKLIWLEVRSSNEVATKFYLGQGFRVMQTRTNFYTNPTDDALLMRLRLPAEGHNQF